MTERDLPRGAVGFFAAVTCTSLTWSQSALKTLSPVCPTQKRNLKHIS